MKEAKLLKNYVRSYQAGYVFGEGWWACGHGKTWEAAREDLTKNMKNQYEGADYSDNYREMISFEEYCENINQQHRYQEQYHDEHVDHIDF